MKRLLFALAALTLLAAPALAQDMNGSYVTLVGPSSADPGDTVTFEFYVYNGSPDAEWTTEVRFRFPETFNVLDGTYDDGGAGWSFDFSTSGDYDEYAHFIDGDGGYGEIVDGTGGTFYVTVFINPNTECGPYNLHWKQYGDEWGDPPHWIGGDLPFVMCPVATEAHTLSGVKSLY